MSVTLTKADGVTVLTLTTDPHSPCPPLCQILKGLCYSPVCCSMSLPLKRVQGTTQSTLGVVQIMVGLLTIGLGSILWYGDGSWGLMNNFWLGPLFIFFGVMCIVIEKHPSPCMVLLNVILSVAGLLFAITAVIVNTVNFFMPGENGAEVERMLLRGVNAVLIGLSLLELFTVLSSAVVGVNYLEENVQKTENKSTDDPEQKQLLESDESLLVP